jgi:NAD-dependent DNA ligase
MKLSDQANAHILEREAEEQINAFRKSANDRKREVYWIGFLGGALSSQRIEEGEEAALLAEADKFREFFDDPDAADLAEDLRAKCFSSEDDMMTQITKVIQEKRRELDEKSSYSETDEMNEFLGFCAGIICDGTILEKEAQAILNRFQASDVLMTSVPFSQLRRAVEVAMDDRVLTTEESEEVREWITQLVGDGFVDTGIPNIGSVSRLDDPITNPSELTLRGARFALTGPMKFGTRTFIQSEIERVGGIYEARTTQRTDYLVVSSHASRHWRTTHFGTKIERAKELIENGHKLRFVSEEALAKAILAFGAERV